MILRLLVKGFKNLYDTEILFGPFNCIAGANGIGKSNLFDAIKFLSEAANHENTILDAAYKIRDERNKKKSPQDVRSLFYSDGKTSVDSFEFEVDMIIPAKGIDHLGQIAEATTTSLKYQLKIGLKKDILGQEGLQIISENLTPITKREMKRRLTQMNASNAWIDSVILGKRGTPFIETEFGADIVTISTDKAGRRKTLKIDQLPRTVLSTATSIESPTMVLAKREFESWKILQFEPSSLRSPDDIVFSESPSISSSGEHLPTTLFRLMNDKTSVGDVRIKIRNELSELLPDVEKIDIDRDEKRDLITLNVTNKAGVTLPARSLSDGTLRFLALALIENDPNMKGVFCLEEPENGIHPERIRPIVKLIENIACDLSYSSDESNPLRQVIINTHSPLVVAEIAVDDLLYGEQTFIQGNPCIDFKFLAKTWRGNIDERKQTLSKGKLLSYLNPYAADEEFKSVEESRKQTSKRKQRIIDSPDFQQLTLFK